MPLWKESVMGEPARLANRRRLALPSHWVVKSLMCDVGSCRSLPYAHFSWGNPGYFRRPKCRLRQHLIET